MNNNTNLNMSNVSGSEQETNPLLSKFRIPPEIHRLPSGGTFYSDDVLDKSTNGEMHFYPMTGLDELEIKSPDLLFSGEAVTNVIRRCVPEITNPNELFIRDVDFILLVLRKATYGAEYEAHFKHDCDKAKEHTYNIDLVDIIRQAKALNPVEFKQKSEFDIGSGDTKYKVTLSPMRLKHLVHMMQSADTANTEDERKSKLYGALTMMIENIDGVSNKQHIFELLSKLPTTWLEPIGTRIEELSKWGPIFSATKVCKDCGAEVDVHININPLSFFTLQ